MWVWHVVTRERMEENGLYEMGNLIGLTMVYPTKDLKIGKYSHI